MTASCHLRASNSVVVLVATASILWFAAGCEAATTHEVTVRNFVFEPPELTIEAGDTVRWTVISGRHSVTASDRLFDSKELETGFTFERRFDEPGAYPYFCTPHDFMRATVTVLPGRSYGSWALAAAGALLLAGAAAFAWRRRPR